MHVRQQVADGVKTLLTAGSAWNLVLVSRLSPARDITPYLMVTVESETTTALDIHDGHVTERELQLTVRGRDRVVEGEALELALAAMQAEIETRVTTAALRGVVGAGLKRLALESITTDIVNDENARTYAEIALEWQVLIYTAEGDPETLI